MVELSNGCICCTLREDLIESVRALAKEKRFDYLLVESSGISEPMPVATTFSHEDEEGRSLLGKVGLGFDTVSTHPHSIHHTHFVWSCSTSKAVACIW